MILHDKTILIQTAASAPKQHALTPLVARPLFRMGSNLPSRVFGVFIPAIAAVCGLVPTADAGISFEFGQSEYLVQPNDTVEVEVFLVQEAPIVDDPVDLSTVGVINVGVKVVFDINTNPPFEPAVVPNENSIFPDAAFDGTGLLAPLLDLELGVSAGFSAGVELDPVFPTGDRIRLGSFVFLAGGTVGEVTDLRAEDFGDSGDLISDDLIDGFKSFDDAVQEGFATIRVVPEPSSVLLMCAALVICRRRRPV